jgi:hypothetical protein
MRTLAVLGLARKELSFLECFQVSGNWQFGPCWLVDQQMQAWLPATSKLVASPSECLNSVQPLDVLVGSDHQAWARKAVELGHRVLLIPPINLSPEEFVELPAAQTQVARPALDDEDCRLVANLLTSKELGTPILIDFRSVSTRVDSAASEYPPLARVWPACDQLVHLIGPHFTIESLDRIVLPGSHSATGLFLRVRRENMLVTLTWNWDAFCSAPPAWTIEGTIAGYRAGRKYWREPDGELCDAPIVTNVSGPLSPADWFARWTSNEDVSSAVTRMHETQRVIWLAQHLAKAATATNPTSA